MGEFNPGFSFDIGHSKAEFQAPWDFSGGYPSFQSCMQCELGGSSLNFICPLVDIEDLSFI